MLNLILQCFYFILPAYVANMAPVIVKDGFKSLKIPIDFNKKILGRNIFGKNKTFRGLIFGILFAIIMAYIQFVFYNNGILDSLALIDYSNWLSTGLLMGSGAIFGDLAESFIKRRLNLRPGESFIPFDQLDFVIGALIFVYPLAILSLNKIILILLLTLILHVVVNHIAYYSRIRKEKW